MVEFFKRWVVFSAATVALLNAAAGALYLLVISAVWIEAYTGLDDGLAAGLIIVVIAGGLIAAADE